MDTTETEGQPAESRSAGTTLPPDTTNNGSNALRLAWSFGFNKDLVGGVHSLTTNARRAIFYTAAHTGVLYDYAQRTQTLLQGHCHPISCCVVSEDKRWIVTADRGSESMIVVWDATTGHPIKTIFQPHTHGVQAIDISPDALFLVTLSAVGPDSSETEGTGGTKKKPRFRQELSVWEWTSPTSSSALHSSLVATEDIQYAVRFNTYDIRELISNGRQRVIFWNWASHKLLFYSPSLTQKDFRQAIGDFTQSLFVPDSTQALTATEDGDLVLWDVVSSADQDASTRFPDRKAVKIVRLASGVDHSKKVAIQFLTDMDGYLVLGSSDGAVRFYDFDFRLVAWFEDLHAGPVLSISFAATTPTSETSSAPASAMNATTQQGPRRSHGVDSAAATDDQEFFHVPEFVVGTSSAFIVGLNAALFAEHDTDMRRGTLLMQGINDEIHGLATHPKYAQVAVSSYSGVLQLWDYRAKRLLMMRKFDTDKLRPQCLTFSPEGMRLFVGFTSGVIKIVHAHRFEDLATLRFSKVAITDIRVSLDASLFVAVDANCFLGMWRAKPTAPATVTTQTTTAAASATPDENASDDAVANTDWTYLGRCRAHTKPITGLEFCQTSDGTPLLVSISEDKTLVEYCLSRSSIVDGIVLTQSPLRMEQSATPTACCWHPEMKSLQEDMLIVATDEYKLKQWNANNKICRKTTLGPSYGGPMNRLAPVPLRGAASSSGTAASERYCAYSTHEKVVGLLKLPLDGNPHKSMGLIAHPGGISNIDVSFDGNYLLTAGGNDHVINLWEVHTHELDLVEASAGSDDLEPYFSLLEGGRDGAFYQEIADYFYFAQLRMQGENATSVREITARIPLQEIPNVMRALGFYPTEQEIQHMWSEVKYSQFTQTTQAVESIDLREFIKLYINHRPVFGIGKHDIEKAFKVLGGGTHAGLKWDTLQKRLLHMGEQMTEDELRSCLDALLIGEEDNSPTGGGDGSTVRMDSHYTALSFADKVLGFDDYQTLEQDDSGAVSGA